MKISLLVMTGCAVVLNFVSLMKVPNVVISKSSWHYFFNHKSITLHEVIATILWFGIVQAFAALVFAPKMERKVILGNFLTKIALVIWFITLSYVKYSTL